jgi:hypothetical protein
MALDKLSSRWRPTCARLLHSTNKHGVRVRAQLVPRGERKAGGSTKTTVREAPGLQSAEVGAPRQPTPRPADRPAANPTAILVGIPAS